jgi:hypothetical protein
VTKRCSDDSEITMIDNETPGYYKFTPAALDHFGWEEGEDDEDDEEGEDDEQGEEGEEDE